jgi:hypothetical protein
MNAIAKAFGDHVASYDWNHWMTGTPASPTYSPGALERHFKRKFVRRVEQRTERRVEWVSVVERSPGGVFHVHAVIAGTATLDVDHVRDCWTLGRVDVERYDPTRGAAWYLSKQYGEVSEHWERFDLSRYMPPRRAAA